MKEISPRIGPIIMLLVAILALSGIAATAETLADANDRIGCCDTGSDSDESGSRPCSLPDCPCASCLTVDHDPPRTLNVTASAVTAFHPRQQLFPPSEFICSIDHPPEQV
ncbi:hypothetical protein [Geobacter sp. DSM 9736]|uniref:hypothetical protein n=1 Tax=Geobacter sp. DSM 9736 TaxID=1277350 RepID=UPI000B60B1F5|nr:hypothetical protein [Geobacter sp. DSM 9736]SNB46242.1 hypothetical protein SAMN06269301_1687 [Geobacter sp. DSM 9736]